jgi:hypothetical protein
MKNILLFMVIFFLAACSNNETKSSEPVNNPVSKNDLVKIKWLSGNWRGMADGKPFYELYEFANDSTIRIIGYDWNGTDSSNTSFSYVSWKEGAYYLGDSLNYKATFIDSSKIEMIPNYKANNDILWKVVNDTTWAAVLKGKTKTVEYKMEKIPSIDSMYKSVKK